MIPLGPSSAALGTAASAAGSYASGAAERAAALDVARHSLAAGRAALSRHPLDSDPNASPDRDADGWTGGSADHDRNAPPSPDSVSSPTAATRSRLPDDPCGGRLDVTV